MGFDPVQWQGGGKGYSDKQQDVSNRYGNQKMDTSSRYQNKGMDTKSRYGNQTIDTSNRYGGTLDTSPMTLGRINDASTYRGEYDLRPQYSNAMPREEKYTFPALIRKLNDLVQEQSKAMADIAGMSYLNDNEIREIRFDIYRYIAKHFTALLLLSIVAAFAVSTVQIFLIKIFVFLLTIGLYWLVLTITAVVLVQGERNVFTELGFITFTIYEAYAKPMRDYMRFAFLYMCGWFIFFLLPLSFGVTYFLEWLKFSNFLYVPISFIVDYRQLDFIDFLTLLGLFISMAYWSSVVIGRTEMATEYERRRRLNDIKEKSGKFEIDEIADEKLFGKELTGIGGSEKTTTRRYLD